MGKVYKVKSPAKINIGLRVLSKRKDGYHNIETIFYPVRIFDEIHLVISPAKENKISVNVSSSQQINNENNICYKAVKLFLKEFKIKENYRIKIKIRKNIPIGAGLGGGSSNAASVLKILAKHFAKLTGSNVSKRLEKHALTLGSDVPFFLQSKPAYATGRGEKLRLLADFNIPYEILIVNPGIHVSTPWAYRELQITNYKLQIKKNFSKIKNFKISDISIYENDFESAVFKKYPAIKKIKEKMLDTGAVFSLMSGSGSTVYGLYKKRADSETESARKFFKRKKYKTFIS